jgi:hypothetical protein
MSIGVAKQNVNENAIPRYEKGRPGTEEDKEIERGSERKRGMRMGLQPCGCDPFDHSRQKRPRWGRHLRRKTWGKCATGRY